MKFKLQLLLLLLPALCQAQRLNAGSGNTAATAQNAYYANYTNIENSGYIATTNMQGFTQFSLNPNFSFVKQLSRGGSACIIKTDSNFRPYKVTEVMRAINLSQGDYLDARGYFDDKKNVYFVAYFSGKIDIAPGTEVKVIQSTYPFPKQDCIVVKYDSAANLKWYRHFNTLSANGDIGADVLKIRKTGDVFIQAGSEQGIKMDSTILIPYSGQYAHILLHLDSLGQFVNYFTVPVRSVPWSAGGFVYFDYGKINVDESGNIYASFVFGQIPGVADGVDLDPGPGVDSLYFPNGSANAQYTNGILKLDSNYNYLGYVYFQGAGATGLSTATILDNKYLMVFGGFVDSVDVNPDVNSTAMFYGCPMDTTVLPNMCGVYSVLDLNLNFITGDYAEYGNKRYAGFPDFMNLYDDQKLERNFAFFFQGGGAVVVKTDTNMVTKSKKIYPNFNLYAKLRQNQKGELVAIGINESFVTSADLDCFTTGVAMVAPYNGANDISFIAIYDSTSYNNNPGVSTHAPLVGGTSIYPTPATHELVVERSAGSPPAAATLYDLWGRVVLATTLTQPRSQIGVGELPNGFYVLRIAGEGRSYKVVVQH